MHKIGWRKIDLHKCRENTSTTKTSRLESNTNKAYIYNHLPDWEYIDEILYRRNMLVVYAT